MMRSALNSWRGNNHLFAVLHAGLGSEFCLKAILCHHNPLLISAHGDRSFRYHALGLSGEKGVKPLEQARTIGMAEAFKDAVIVMQGRMPVTIDEFSPVMDSRNGIAHLAHHDPGTAEQVVAIALRVADAIRKELQIPADEFWGEYANIFGDLSRIAAMTFHPKVTLEKAAESLAIAEAAEAALAASQAVASAVTTATGAVTQIPLWGDTLETDKAADFALRVSRRAIMSAALHTTAMRAQRTASELLKSYGYIPADEDCRVPAHAAVGVKTLVAQQVEQSFRSSLLPELRSALEAPSSDVGWRPRPYASSNYGSYLYRWEPCPACPAWGDMYGWLETDVCIDEECNSGGSWCGEHDEGPPIVAHSLAFTCPVCCLVLDTADELEAAGMELATRHED